MKIKYQILTLNAKTFIYPWMIEIHQKYFTRLEEKQQYLMFRVLR